MQLTVGAIVRGHIVRRCVIDGQRLRRRGGGRDGTHSWQLLGHEQDRYNEAGDGHSGDAHSKPREPRRSCAKAVEQVRRRLDTGGEIVHRFAQLALDIEFHRALLAGA